MRVSVIIPAYNSEAYLDETISSVLAQSVADWELVIVDDGSADATGELARAFAEQDSRVRVVRQANAGMAAARDRGLAETDPSSEYVAFLDHDDLWHRDTVAVLTSALDSQPWTVAAHGLARYVNERSQPVALGRLEAWGRQRRGIAGTELVPWPQQHPTTFDVLAYTNCIATMGAILIRRAALDQVGQFDPAAAPCDDWDLYLRLSTVGEIAFIDRVVVDWRAHDLNATRASAGRLVANRGRYVRRKLLASRLLTDEQRRTVLIANWHLARSVRAMRLARTRALLAHGELGRALEQIGHGIADHLASIRGIPVAAPVFLPTLKELFHRARASPSDINEHLDTLCRLARRCRHITEFGTRGGASTTALLNARPAVLLTYDRERYWSVAVLEQAAQDAGRTRFRFRQADVLNVEIEATDMLFIDTWHTYEQLKQELALHAHKVRKYLVFHDTATFGEAGEAPGSRGLWPAIEEFLRDHPEWSLAARLENNNGLTILTRGRAPLPAVRPSVQRQRAYH
jgi:glycosyltransferase involved in cell wall biosynthesis/predicted O-methyltransferase YrrM